MGVTIKADSAVTPYVVGYATREDVEAIFGSSNVAKWADMDNLGLEETITARINAALQYAAAQIDSRLGVSGFTVPLELIDGGDEYPVVIVNLAAALAGVWLYESRGIEDKGEIAHRLVYNKTKALEALEAIATGRLAVGCKRSGPSFPRVIRSNTWTPSPYEHCACNW